MSGSDDEECSCFASPPCFMHEIDPAYAGMTADRQQEIDVGRWRKAERTRLIAKRLAISTAVKCAHGAAIAGRLKEAIGDPAGLTVSAYWPFRGEPDLRDLMQWVVSRGGRTALPVVVEKTKPLIFRAWSPGEPLERGIWNIPIPAAGPAVVPDIVISPVVGFDPNCYRLGYGGGFSDRTLASWDPKPRILGVGYALQAVPTIHPQPHDIPMDCIATEKGMVTPAGSGEGSGHVRR